MKVALVTCFLLAVATTYSYPTDSFDLNLEEEWANFKQTYSRDFNSVKDDSTRKEIFEENLRKIKIHNLLFSRGIKSFEMTINEFADMTSKEASSMLNGLRIPTNYTKSGSTHFGPLQVAHLPTDIDWRTKGYVTPVKNQGGCGSCWAFSATGAMEGQHFKQTGKLVSLSEQNLVDCSKSYGNHGCGGGLMDLAFKYVNENGGVDTEKSYPYAGYERKCAFEKENVGATVTGFTDIESGNEQMLTDAVANIGPISVGIDASHNSFLSYGSGVYEEPNCSPQALDHGVLVVGYGTENGKDYWLVKNSWGENWGERGYIKMARNKNNQCGIATLASYPNV